jgi:adenine deaminase
MRTAVVTTRKAKYPKGARLIDGRGGPVIENDGVLIEGTRIKPARAPTQVQTGTGTEVIDVGSCTIMPGMFDLHVHIAAFDPCSFNNCRVSIFDFAGSGKASGARSREGNARFLGAVQGIE